MVGHDVKSNLLSGLGCFELLVVGDVGQGNSTEDAKSFDKTLVIGGEYAGLLVDQGDHTDDVALTVPDGHAEEGPVLKMALILKLGLVGIVSNVDSLAQRSHQADDGAVDGESVLKRMQQVLKILFSKIIVFQVVHF